MLIVVDESPVMLEPFRQWKFSRLFQPIDCIGMNWRRTEFGQFLSPVIFHFCWFPSRRSPVIIADLRALSMIIRVEQLRAKQY